MRPFGYPAYILDPRIHGGKKIPKWDPKSKHGQFLGMSKQHASTIGLICNLTTGSVTLQYHVVYNELFTTVPSRAEFDQQQPANWIDLLTYSRDYALEDVEPGDIPELGIDWLSEEELQQKQEWQHCREQRLNRLPAEPEGVIAPMRTEDDDDDDDEVPALVVQDEEPDEEEQEPEPVVPAAVQPPEAPVLHRSQCIQRPNPCYYGEEFVNLVDRSARQREFEEHFGLIASGDLLLKDLESFLENPKDHQTAMFCALHATRTDEDG